MITVRILSKIILVVALISLVTLIPAKLKKAILNDIPKNYLKNKFAINKDNIYTNHILPSINDRYF